MEKEKTPSPTLGFLGLLLVTLFSILAAYGLVYGSGWLFGF